ncbi:lanthionine synthetase C family protein [Streptomyces sp. B1866]|uniref:lanthionine synthetase C family protein n=1 Tax=Streptomyces sp. B1866 TaxID=3075431 RepID=UPI002890294C|nr:lanthionine synthetase C family protein [Streptomyces sp. B1866]MDT3396323.1 lanthionine synthetase C family protein [Streptomyces sp. B1866]
MSTPASAAPPAHDPQDARSAQSLSRGAIGIALLHIERAHAGLGDWDTAHSWINAATRTSLSAADGASLFFGVPAVAFTLRAAGADGTPRYAGALARLDAHVTALAHRRTQQAEARIAHGLLPHMREFDVINGLTGIGAHLLKRAPSSSATERVLTYLVRLTEPLRVDDETLPGWWTGHGPFHASTRDFPGGHGNFGLAHGITGPLALLALALRGGAAVDGHTDAIERICAWLDTWRQDHTTGPWWPQWLTREDLRTGRPKQPGPLRPSWCYGTPGLARAQQLAAIATGDAARQLLAEQALVGCLTDSAQLDRIADTSLCHGWAGLFQTVWRAAREARTPALAAHLPDLTNLLARHSRAAQQTASHQPGLLEGDAGSALALHTAARGAPPVSEWDACLLIG